MFQKEGIGYIRHHDIEDLFPLQIRSAIKSEADEMMLTDGEKDFFHRLVVFIHHTLATNSSATR
jgi:hypothetical protein